MIFLGSQLFGQASGESCDIVFIRYSLLAFFFFVNLLFTVLLILSTLYSVLYTLHIPYSTVYYLQCTMQYLPSRVSPIQYLLSSV